MSLMVPIKTVKIIELGKLLNILKFGQFYTSTIVAWFISIVFFSANRNYRMPFKTVMLLQLWFGVGKGVSSIGCHDYYACFKIYVVALY